jgi:hypothetical protein
MYICFIFFSSNNARRFLEFNEKNPRSSLPFSYESVSKDHGFFSFYFSCSRKCLKILKFQFIEKLNEKNP